MKEAQIFENWINNLSEGTWALPETPEQMEKLNQLMSAELIVGPDATNATELLYDIVGDDELFDILNDLADKSQGRANIWDDSDVQRRLAELGVQTPQSTQAEPADVPQDTAPAVKEDDMAEAAKWRDPKYKDQLYTQEPQDSDEYDNIGYGYDFPERPENDPGQKRRMGGVGSEYDRTDPLVKGASIGRTGIKHNMNTAGSRKGMPSRDQIRNLKQSIRDIHGKHSRPNLPEGDNRATFVEDSELAEMLKYAGVPVKESVLTDSTGSTLEHIKDTFRRDVKDFTQTGDMSDALYDALYDYYFDDMPYGTKKARDGDPHEWVSNRFSADIGLDENLISPMIMPVAEGSCNMTMEGSYCPEHGLAECGSMYEDGGAVGMPYSMGEGTDDPINSNSAMTGSYYEGKETDVQAGDALLARIKSLALLR